MSTVTKLEELGIDLHGKRFGQIKTQCPACSEGRSKSDEACLSVNISEGVYKCHHCEFEGGVESKYVRPKETGVGLDQKVIDFFESRKISKETLERNRITTSKESMPGSKGKVGVVCFNYYQGDKLINIKYRTADKRFKTVADAELIFYGINDITSDKMVVEDFVIVEGEIDKLSFDEVGAVNCVSIPQGASDRKMHYLDHAKDQIESAKRIYLAIDNDEKGHELEEELARRIGKHKCLRVPFGDRKDANDVLVQDGPEALIDCLRNAKPYPVEGVITVTDMHEDIVRLYTEGLKPGDKLGHEGFDKLISWTTPQLTVVGGVPSHGKSSWMDWIALRLSVQHGWKVAMFSPENYPHELHFSSIAEKYLGNSFRQLSVPGSRRINADELRQAEQFIGENFFWIRPADNVYTIDNILDVAAGLVYQHGVKMLIIDPYNKIQHDMDGMSETQYINEFLNKLNYFKQIHGLHICLVAHPRKMNKRDDGQYEVPTLYDINGSSHFYNQTDNGITVYRDFKNEVISVFVQKVKFKHLGEVGYQEFKYNLQNGRYYEWSSAEGQPTEAMYNEILTPDGTIL